MGFRFRRTKSIIPGVRLNVGKRGVSVSVGPKGLKHTFGTSGSRTTVGLPGTGLSYTKKHGGKKSKHAPRATTKTSGNNLPPLSNDVANDAVLIKPKKPFTKRPGCLIAIGIVLFLSIISGIFGGTDEKKLTDSEAADLISAIVDDNVGVGDKISSCSLLGGIVTIDIVLGDMKDGEGTTINEKASSTAQTITDAILAKSELDDCWDKININISDSSGIIGRSSLDKDDIVNRGGERNFASETFEKDYGVAEAIAAAAVLKAAAEAQQKEQAAQAEAIAQAEAEAKAQEEAAAQAKANEEAASQVEATQPSNTPNANNGDDETANNPAVDTSQRYIASSESDKFHHTGCSYADRINEGNRIYFDSREAA
ncbi:MAG: DUF4236 domain-containing protein, partial [Clostridiales Family XIII bacterium]|nr:DUF4236 domain-containing protein [Clostridiales Family XIII bacterium]